MTRTVCPFISTPIRTYGKKRIQERDHVSEKEAAETLREVDEKRSAFQEQCTATRWGDGNEYDLCIDTGKIGIEKSCRINFAVYRIQEMKKAEAFTLKASRK